MYLPDKGQSGAPRSGPTNKPESVYYNIARKNTVEGTTVVIAARCVSKADDYVFYDLNGAEVERFAQDEVEDITTTRIETESMPSAKAKMLNAKSEMLEQSRINDF
jgi:hypothetical protein